MGAAWNKRPGRSSTSWIRKSTRCAIYHRDGHACVYCGGGDKLTLDHIVPRVCGGTNEATNLVTACLGCNSSRQHKPLPARMRLRAERAAAKPLNRDEGRRLAAAKRGVKT